MKKKFNQIIDSIGYWLVVQICNITYQTIIIPIGNMFQKLVTGGNSPKEDAAQSINSNHPMSLNQVPMNVLFAKTKSCDWKNLN